MNEKLIKFLGLAKTASEDEIVAAVKVLNLQAAAASEISKDQKVINLKVAQSGGSLDAARAAQSVAHQASFDNSPIGRQFAKNAIRKG